MANSIIANPEYQDSHVIPTAIFVDNADQLLIRIEFTLDGIKRFFTVFNHPKVAKEILPNNPSYYIEQFFTFGISTHQDLEYFKRVLHLFHKKFKEVEYISAEALPKLFVLLINLTESLSALNQSINQKHVSLVKNIAYEEFLNNFVNFKKDPDTFLTTLSSKICDALSSGLSEQHETTPHQIKHLMLRFVESILSKTLWSPQDGDAVWSEFNKLGDAIVMLHEKKIISDGDDVDDLLKTLVERFTYFLSLAGADMPLSFYEKARTDLITKKIAWLELEELEKEVTSKQESLRQALMRSQIKAQARHSYGIIADSH